MVCARTAAAVFLSARDSLPHKMGSNSGLLILGILLCGAALAGSADLQSDLAALIRFKAAVGRGLKWNSADTSPCSWTGVYCVAGRVSSLRLPGAGLLGVIPAGTIGSLDALTVLSLRWNRLSGALPADLANCTLLRSLYLQHNVFTGSLSPALFSSWPSLVRLNLGFNDFSGAIPDTLNGSVRLGTIYLQNNNLSGTIPALSLAELKQFNVSNNHLTGSVPRRLRQFGSSAFSGNSLCGAPVLPACPGEVVPAPAPAGAPTSIVPSGKHHHHHRLSAGAIVGIVLGSFVALLLLLLIVFLVLRRKKSEKISARDLNKGPEEIAEATPPDGVPEDPFYKDEAGASASTVTAVAAAASDLDEAKAATSKTLVFFPGAQRTFALEDLLRASAEVLGKGSVGTAYKAVLDFGLVVAVKRLKDVVIGAREFVQQIEQVGSMTHPYLVPLRAYYFSKEEKLLVYDYMPVGSLSSVLHGNRSAGRTPLDWITRCRIALGAARGIEYIHSIGAKISHGNIKSSNILLTKEYEARVSDFGLAQLVSATTSANRIIGYRAPEVIDARKISQKADVYSFGVLLLELLTGKAPNQGSLNEEVIDLPRWVQSTVREEWTAEVFDVELLRSHDREEDMVSLLQIALECVTPHPDQRPTMSDLVGRIEEVCGGAGKAAAP